MLNPKLFLNPDVFSDNVTKEPTRSGYGKGLVTLGTNDPRVVVLTADLTESTKVDGFAKQFPTRFIECGVSEQHMAALGAGLGVSGKVAFISSYATFSPGKNWETIRTTIVYNNANVKIAGHHSGVVTGPDGATHQATEDIAITRCWPNMSVFVPCDSIEAEKITMHAGTIDGPVYMRFTRDKTPVMTTQQTPFDPNAAPIFWEDDNPQVTLFATGHLLYYALCAAKQLETVGIQTLVVNVPTIKPLPEKDILAAVAKSKKAVSIEDHQVMGGLGGALAELFAQKFPIPMRFVGLQNTFAESGSPKELIEKYNLGTNATMQAVRDVAAQPTP